MGKPLFSRIVLCAIIIFLFIPLFVVIIFSFNANKGGEWTGFSLIWYEKLFFSSDSLWRAFSNSVIVALSSAVCATILGTLAAIGMKWYRFPGRRYITVLTYLPMILPEVIIGISMLIFFCLFDMGLSLLTIFIAHTTFNLPFAFMLVSARLDEFDYTIVEAARDLGAGELETLTKVVIPALKPGIIAAFIMCITMSIDDFVITFFVSGPASTTLPLYVYSSIRYGVSPVINALSFLMILITMLIAFIMRRFLKTIATT